MLFRVARLDRETTSTPYAFYCAYVSLDLHGLLGSFPEIRLPDVVCMERVHMLSRRAILNQAAGSRPHMEYSAIFAIEELAEKFHPAPAEEEESSKKKGTDGADDNANECAIIRSHLELPEPSLF